MAKESIFALQDLGVVLDGVKTKESLFLLRSNVLFHSTPLPQASSEQNRHVREDLCITTVLDTLPTTFQTDSLMVDRALGMTHCRVQLRNKTFGQDLLDEQPLWKRASFKIRADLAAVRPHTRQGLVSEAADMARKRSVVDEGIAILKAASKCGLVKYIFNEILATDTEAIPLLVSGDVKTRDSLIILFLVLVMLGFDEGAIKRVVLHLQGTNNFAADFIELLKKHFDAEYGSKENFFHCAGVTKQAQSTICERLLISATEEKTMSLLD